MNLYLRKATLDDVGLLYEWINDPISRKSAFESNDISYQKYCEWYNNIFENGNVCQYIFMIDDIPIGQVRLNVERDMGEIAYSVSPKYKLYGYGNEIIALVKQQIKADHIKVRYLYATVKSENVAAQRFLIKNFFKEKNGHYEDDIKLSENLMENVQNIEQGGILFLSNNKNALPLYEWIMQKAPCSIYSDRIFIEQIDEYRPSLIISYNYNYIISKDIIEYMQGNIINMHISMLPWNRGFSPNIWSFIDSTPKGVTIHRISAGLDKGDIIYQKELTFDEKEESFESSYQKLNNEIVELFKSHWDEIYNGTYTIKKQKGVGSYHSLADLQELQSKISFNWSDNIQDFLERYRKI